jgi:hypothetical protein
MNEKYLNIAFFVVQLLLILYIEPFKPPSKTKFRYCVKLVMESCHILFVEKLVIGLITFLACTYGVYGMDPTHCKLTLHCLQG